MNTIIGNPQTIQLTEGCIKGTYRFTHTIYQNICTGTQSLVANGFWDYTIGVLAVIFIIVLILGVARSILD